MGVGVMVLFPTLKGTFVSVVNFHRYKQAENVGSQQLQESVSHSPTPPLSPTASVRSPALTNGVREWQDALIDHHHPEQRMEELLKDTTLLLLPPVPSVPIRARRGRGTQDGPLLSLIGRKTP